MDITKDQLSDYDELTATIKAMLTQQLRSLEQDGLINRKVYPVVPQKVEYSLMPLGTELHLAFEALEARGNHFICKEHEKIMESASCQKS